MGGDQSWPGGNAQGERGEVADDDLVTTGGDVRAMHQDPEGSLWFGTSEGVLCYKNRSWTVLTAKNGLATNDVRVIIDGRAENLWIGGYGGGPQTFSGDVQRGEVRIGLEHNNT